jgi:RNA polymerase sigma factor (sigma-70 family)
VANKSLRSSYEDQYEIIEEELNKRKGRWFLKSLAWMDYDDVKQIIRMHLYKKWDLWDQERPLKPWLNRIISNQLKNILRNHYSNFARPCLNCPFNQSGIAESDVKGMCGFTSSRTQCNECPLFAKWEKTKKSAFDVKMPVAIESHIHEIESEASFSFGIEDAEQRLHDEMKKALPAKNYEIYIMLFVENLPEEEIAKKLGYRTTETGRKAGYKQIKNLKKQFKARAEKILKTKDIFYGKDRLK